MSQGYTPVRLISRMVLYFIYVILYILKHCIKKNTLLIVSTKKGIVILEAIWGERYMRFFRQIDALTEFGRASEITAIATSKEAGERS